MRKVVHKQLQVENSAPLLPSIQQQGENNDTAGAVLIFCLHLHPFSRHTG
jgi:hypothetical protein